MTGLRLIDMSLKLKCFLLLLEYFFFCSVLVLHTLYCGRAVSFCRVNKPATGFRGMRTFLHRCWGCVFDLHDFPYELHLNY